ncbi:hypothetical protein DM860_015507 [Cuscuta australis]|uniref:Uncharacterized protein n=1 Tax=Cuscuta australis TaxID=267555 RepID=A0A328DLN7_9ASTE|nr:hypothetical protein DM860_015507 [Cuscuta australis]
MKNKYRANSQFILLVKPAKLNSHLQQLARTARPTSNPNKAFIHRSIVAPSNSSSQSKISKPNLFCSLTREPFVSLAHPSRSLSGARIAFISLGYISFGLHQSASVLQHSSLWRQATGLCKNRAEPNLLNTVLREKLDKSILGPNKDNNTRKDGFNFQESDLTHYNVFFFGLNMQGLLDFLTEEQHVEGQLCQKDVSRITERRFATVLVVSVNSIFTTGISDSNY